MTNKAQHVVLHVIDPETHDKIYNLSHWLLLSVFFVLIAATYLAIAAITLFALYNY